MTTLKEVAERAGVSSATVSKVLSNTPYVSAPTRERVLKAIDDLGYTPNLAARALATGRTFNIGVIFPFIYTSLFADVQVTSILEGVEAAASERGYNILISSPTLPVEESELYRRFVRSRYFDGVIVLENLPDDLMSSFIAEHGYPFVTLGYHTSHANGDNSVRLDDYGGAYAAAKHLTDLGHRNIGIITVGPTSTFFIGERMRGFCDAFRAAGFSLDDMPQACGAYSIASGEAAMQQLLASHPRPTAVLCLNDLMAVGAMRAARADRLHIPHDLSIVGFDDIPMAAYLDPPLTTVRQPSREIGYRAACILLDLIEKKQVAFDPVEMPTSLIVRESSAAPKEV